MNNDLTKDQWQAVAEKLAEYLEEKVEDDFDFTRWSRELWLIQAKKELECE